MIEEKKEYTLEEYLTKDENGITLLENLLKEGKDISYWEEKKLINSLEACYLYIKYNRSLFDFELTEDQLYTNINGKPFIEIILDSKCAGRWNFVKKIKNNLTIVDFIIEKNDYYLFYLNDELKEKIVKKDINNECYIEKYFDNEKDIKSLIEICKNPIELIKLCEEKNKLELLKYCSEASLIVKINENETLLDYLLSKNIIPEKLEKLVNNNDDFIRLIVSRNLFDFIKNDNENVLNVEIEKNKILLEILIDKGLLNEIDFDICKEETIKVLYKKNKLNLIKILSCELLCKSCNDFGINYNGSLVNYLLDNNYNFTFYSFLSRKEDAQSVINCLYNRKQFSIIGQSLNGENLLYEVEPGISLLEKLLDENVDIDFGFNGINNIDVINIIFKKNRLDLFQNVKVDLLLNLVNEKENYLDYLLEAVKNKQVKINLNSLHLYFCSLDIRAKFYISIAKHDMVRYIGELTEEKLLKESDGRSLLDELIDLDKDLAINKLLDKRLKSNIKIATILKSKGINIENVNISLENNELSYDYLKENRMRQGIGPIQENGEYLLNKLKNLFINDGESDIDLIAGLITGYRQALINNYEVFIKEIENLIQIKENNKEFRYLKQDDSGYFSKNTGSVHCENSNISTLMHETGHALHWYMAEDRVPENLNEVIEKVRNNIETLKKTEQISNDFYKIKESILKLVEVKYEEYFRNYYSIEKNNEIIDFLLKSKEEKKEEFKDLGLDDDVLDIILNDYFSSEEYIKTQKRLFIEQNVDDVLREEYGNILSVSDILDGIYEGDFRSFVLKNKDNEIIKGTYGHGIAYYSNRDDFVFYEMIANFSEIIKSPNPSEGLSLLRNTVGDELYNLISEFYYNNIIYKQQEKSKSL